MTIEELKAKAYDLIAILETAKVQLQQVNAQIARMTEEEKKAAAKEE